MVKGTKRALLTPRGISAMVVGTWAADPAARGMGVLQVRKLMDGTAAFYYRYTAPGGERVRLPIGNGIDLREARRLAAEMSRRYQSGDHDLRTVLDTEERERERLREAAAIAHAAAAARAQATLGALLEAYVVQLRRDGKTSAESVEGAVVRHVKHAWPALWTTPAESVDMDHLLPVIARLVNAGKLREAGKLRSYIRAAYAAAIRSRQDARGLAALRDLKITRNPARDLATVDGATRSRDRALSVAELRAYWRHVASLPDAAAALLRFHLLTGGQRVKQLSRLTMDDYDADVHSVRIMDKKGRRKVARAHDVPLIPAAVEALQAMGHELGDYLFTLTHGASPATYGSMRDHVVTVRDAMEAAGELEKGPFTVGDLRRTVETRLAAAGVQSDDLAHLQSHGLGGVQSRHYNKHDYLHEKRAALEALHRLLTGEAANVTPIKRRTS